MEEERTMITFVSGSSRFTYRVGAIVIRHGYVLLTRNLNDDYWFVPGGRVEMGELASQALARELHEEIGVSGQIGRLLWVNENFFRIGTVLHHELGLYFLAVLPNEAHRDISARFHSEETGGARFEFGWHRTDRLGEIRVVPGFLTEAIMQVPSTVEHIVHVDESAN